MNVMPHGGTGEAALSPNHDAGGRMLAGRTQPPASSPLRELLLLIRTVLLALVLMALLQRFVFNLSVVEGHSMEPTLSEGDWLIVNKLAMTMSAPHHGDVMIIRDPEPDSESHEFLVKRVVGLPGDVIELRGGQLYLNGEPLREPYASTPLTEGIFPPVTIGKDKLFVMGDNRLPQASRDSRAFGLVDQQDVRGRAEFVLWPAGHIDKL